MWIYDCKWKCRLFMRMNLMLVCMVYWTFFRASKVFFLFGITKAEMSGVFVGAGVLFYFFSKLLCDKDISCVIFLLSQLSRWHQLSCLYGATYCWDFSRNWRIVSIWMCELVFTRKIVDIRSTYVFRLNEN